MVLKVWSPDQAICSDQEIVKNKNSPRATGSKALGVGLAIHVLTSVILKSLRSVLEEDDR